MALYTSKSLSSRIIVWHTGFMKTNKVNYPSDLSDERWAILGPLIRAATRQPGKIDRRAIMDAIFYQLRTGC